MTAAPLSPAGLFYSDRASLALTTREQERYSICGAINAVLTGDWAAAGLERECSRAIAKAIGREAGPGGFFLPSNLSTRASYATTSTATGGAVVATNLLASSFIEALVSQLVVQKTGCTVLGGLVGNVDLPRRSSRAQACWVTEGQALGESEGSFDKITLKPKQCGAISTMSRLALQQATPDLEFLVRSDLTTILALAIDYAALYGSGTSGQPLGIVNTPGINSYTMGTNGGALTDLDPMISLRAKVAAANADATAGCFVTNERVRAALMKLKTTVGEYIFSPEGESPSTVPTLFGNPLHVSNQIPSNLTKGTSAGVCSAAIFGDFSQLVLGMWGATEILINPYGQGFNSGSVDVRVFQSVDFGVRHPESFAVVSDIIA